MPFFVALISSLLKTHFKFPIRLLNLSIINRSLTSLVSENNVRSLNSAIREFSVSGLSEKVLDIYVTLRLSGFKPDNFTFPFVLKACGHLNTLKDGQAVHTHILKVGFETDVYVANSLIDMYAKCECLEEAENVFDKMPERNLTSYYSLVSGYKRNGFVYEALELCDFMRILGLKHDRVGLKIIFPLCALSQCLKLGESIHAYAIASNLSSDLGVKTAILDMYAKCGMLEAAREIFDGILVKDVVVWNAMMSGYLGTKKPEKVLQLLREMCLERVPLSLVTVLLVLQACADLAALNQGKFTHGHIIKLGLESNAKVEGLLIDMYSKCGSLNSASKVFNSISGGNVNSWSAMISGLGMHGYGRASLMVFFGMMKRNIEPDWVTFLCILASSSHCGLVKEGEKFFDYMSRGFGIEPRMEHYTCMVDLLGRAGHIEEALRFIQGMPIEADASVWGAFLGGCKIHGKTDEGQSLEREIVNLGPRTGDCYVLLSSFNAEKGNWDGVMKTRGLMRERTVKKTPGCSLIQVNG
ncbi:hypothetical protein AMTRI_Chr07g81300 [Amborella trichopoda]